MGWEFQEGAESVSEFGALDAGGFDSDFILEVIKQHDGSAEGKGGEESLHDLASGGLRVFIDGIEFASSLLRKELAEARVEVGDIDAMQGAGVTEVDDAVERQGTAVIWKLAGFQRTQQAAGEGGLADAAATDDCHEAEGVVFEEVADELCVEVAILKPGGSDQRRRVDELGLGFGADGFFGLAHALQTTVDGLLDPLFGGLGIIDDGLLLGDLALELGYVVLDAGLLIGLGAG